jgi:hypothetical protein
VERASFLGQEAVLHREETRGHAVARVDLAVDVLDVVTRRLRRHVEPFCNLLRRKTPRQEP